MIPETLPEDIARKIAHINSLRREKAPLIKLLEVIGNTFEVSESKLEAYAIISAMLQTYFWFQRKVLSDLGVTMGLGEDEANAAVYETLKAALNIMFKSGEKCRHSYGSDPC